MKPLTITKILAGMALDTYSYDAIRDVDDLLNVTAAPPPREQPTPSRVMRSGYNNSYYKSRMDR